MISPKDLSDILAGHARWCSGVSGGVKAYLAGAYLTGANLAGANLAGANLAGATLAGANLTGANLTDANLAGANLAGANLRDANLRGANLAGATLTGATLTGANLAGANLASFQLTPDGGFFGWKKLIRGRLAKLWIPAEARRVTSIVGRKCRAEWVETVAIYAPFGGEENEGYSGLFNSAYCLLYRVGLATKSDSWNDDIRVECAPGIHFFITREEAQQYG